MSVTATPAATRTARGLSAPVLVGGAFLLSTVANICFQLAAIVFADVDPYGPEGPVESIVTIAVVGGAGLVVALAIALPLVRHPARARVGALVLGVLALVTAPFFWSGVPAVFGASAAWLAGLTKGAHPQTGAARGFGIVGFVVAVLVVVAVFVGSAFGIPG